jgi:hypothetical protein
MVGRRAEQDQPKQHRGSIRRKPTHTLRISYVIEASRICAGRVFGLFWEISGTEGTIVNNGERFNELQVFRMRDEKRDRGFTTIYCGSQVPQYSALILPAVASGILTSRYSKCTTSSKASAETSAAFPILRLAPGIKKSLRP